jgi:hypothetical protein
MSWIRRAPNPSSTRPAGSLTLWETIAEELGPDPELQNAVQRYREQKAIALTTGEGSVPALEMAFRNLVIRRLHAVGKTALCFSGGGIRSATFGLGVMQGLAAHSVPTEKENVPPLLHAIDYLSTVSGGGYLGAWFSAWAARAPGGVPQVIQELASAPETDWEPEPAPLRQLRRFVNYLNPRIGALSADTWTLVATVLRNILLNWLVLIPLIASVLALPRILYKLVGELPTGTSAYLLWSSAGLLVLGVIYMVVDLPSAADARLSQQRFLLFGLMPVVMSSIGFVLYWAWQGYLESEPSASGFVVYGIAIMASGVLVGTLIAWWKRGRLELRWVLQGSLFAIASGAIGGLFACWMTWAFTNPQDNTLYSERIYTWLAVPGLLGVFGLAQGVLVGLASAITGDEDREWFARASAWILIALVCCFAFTGIALMPPLLAEWLPALHWQAVISVATGALASRLGYSGEMAATEEKESELTASRSLAPLLNKWAATLAITVFLFALLALLATFNEMASGQLTAWLVTPPLWSPLRPIASPEPALVECLLVGLLAVPALLMSRFIDANKFSLHAMYRSRLIRTFLGSSNAGRSPNPFTGFDPNDNLPMATLPPKPLHVVNTTLNLVKGQNLAWQQRKGESFTATKYRVGSCRVGYQSSAVYVGGLTLGSAIAVSGAAANPNMGYASSPLLSIVMMLFNARLGAWAPNPGEAGRDCWSKGGPTFSVLPFIDEAFGLTTDTNAWVNLSDGGHFENLAVYEMVLRRCATIIAVDGSADPQFHFEDLGNAIRKIYVDMGIVIEFMDGVSILKERLPSSRHCAIAKIRYSGVDGSGAPDGTLIYIKSSLTGNEPEDVLNYAAQNPTFPHESTADQWFTESQFEAYRRLGYHIVEEIFRFKEESVSLAEFADRARSYSGSSRTNPAA